MAMTMKAIVEESPAALRVRPRSDFVDTPAVQEWTRRGLAYLAAGFPIHFRGPAGSGKTTLALHVAGTLGRPVVLVAGDEEFGTSDMIGGQFGFHYKKLVDNYIHSVMKYEEDAVQRWVDQRLTVACREGFTLVYDEFTRSRPEANNVLLAVLEERMLVLPTTTRESAYVKVHPEFRAIFTSNAQEYAGVHAAQDALFDRMVTMDLDYYDRDTEVAITAARSGISEEEAAGIVDFVREFRDSGNYDQIPSLRSSIMIAKVASMQGARPSGHDPHFVNVCLDVLESKNSPPKDNAECRGRNRQFLIDLIERHCDGSSPVKKAKGK